MSVDNDFQMRDLQILDLNISNKFWVKFDNPISYLEDEEKVSSQKKDHIRIHLNNVKEVHLEKALFIENISILEFFGECECFHIHESCFQKGTLVKLKLPSATTVIFDKFVFQDSNITEVVFDRSSNLYVNSFAFDGSKLDTFIVPNDLKELYLSANCFSNCNIREFTFGKDLQSCKFVNNDGSSRYIIPSNVFENTKIANIYLERNDNWLTNQPSFSLDMIDLSCNIITTKEMLLENQIEKKLQDMREDMRVKFQGEKDEIVNDHEIEIFSLKKKFTQEKSEFESMILQLNKEKDTLALQGNNNMNIKILEDEKDTLIKSHEDDKNSLIKSHEEDRDTLIKSHEEDRDTLIKSHEEDRDTLIKSHEDDKNSLIKSHEEEKDTLIKSHEEDRDILIKSHEEDRDILIKSHEKDKNSLIKSHEDEKKTLFNEDERNSLIEERTNLLNSFLDEKNALINSFEEEKQSLLLQFQKEQENLGIELQSQLDQITTESEKSHKEEILTLQQEFETKNRELVHELTQELTRDFETQKDLLIQDFESKKQELVHELTNELTQIFEKEKQDIVQEHEQRNILEQEELENDFQAQVDEMILSHEEEKKQLNQAIEDLKSMTSTLKNKYDSDRRTMMLKYETEQLDFQEQITNLSSLLTNSNVINNDLSDKIIELTGKNTIYEAKLKELNDEDLLGKLNLLTDKNNTLTKQIYQLTMQNNELLGQANVLKQKLQVKPPITNQPMINQPMINQPMINQPIINQPMINQPMINQPITNQPITNQPARQSFSQIKSSGGFAPAVSTAVPTQQPKPAPILTQNNIKLKKRVNGV